MGYDNTIGIIASLLYGLSTMALPYGKTFFREPLIIFLLLGSWLAFLNLDHSKKKRHYVARISFPVFSSDFDLQLRGRNSGGSTRSRR